jgi:hypothetical protein
MPALATAAIVLVVGIVALGVYLNSPGIGVKPSPTPSASPTGPTWGGLWPQTTLEEVRQAQERADAGDPKYTWQVDAGLLSQEWWAYIKSGGVEIVERFLADELGWEHYVFSTFLPAEYPSEEGVLRVVYLRCEPGATNTLYDAFPDGHNGSPGVESCAPTIDELHYETVSLDIKQPGNRGATGIWVVDQWSITAPFAQVDPAVAEAEATSQLQEFLAARVAGDGAEGRVDLVGFGTTGEVPLLYATSAGAPYERFELALVSGPEWPYAWMEFEIQLFANGGETVVSQPIRWMETRLTHRPTDTTENSEPVPAAYEFFDGLMTMSAASPWGIGLGYALELNDEAREAIVFVSDPRAVLSSCGSAPEAVDADALASSLLTNSDLEISSPRAVTLGGANALEMDVSLAPEARDCGGWWPVVRPAGDSDRGAANLGRGVQMHLYLVDLPEGSSSPVMGIAVVAAEARFDVVMAAATPIIDSIEFHVR